jgi:hypothetical protein
MNNPKKDWLDTPQLLNVVLLYGSLTAQSFSLLFCHTTIRRNCNFFFGHSRIPFPVYYILYTVRVPLWLEKREEFEKKWHNITLCIERESRSIGLHSPHIEHHKSWTSKYISFLPLEKCWYRRRCWAFQIWVISDMGLALLRADYFRPWSTIDT